MQKKKDIDKVKFENKIKKGCKRKKGFAEEGGERRKDCFRLLHAARQL